MNVDAQNLRCPEESGEEEECLIVIKINIITPDVLDLIWIRNRTPIVNLSREGTEHGREEGCSS